MMPHVRGIFLEVTLFSLMMFALFYACAPTPHEARVELERLGIQYSEEAFIESVRTNDVVAVELFLTAGMNPDVEDEDGQTALIWAAMGGHVGIVKELIRHDADVDRENRKGQTALAVATENGHREIVRLLKKAGAMR